MTLEELLTMPLTERVKWLRSADGPRGKMSHDRLAKELGTTRQTVIGWEGGVEPRRFADALAEFSGFPREVWLRRGAEAASLASFERRLRSLEETVDVAGKETAKALRALTRAIERLEQRLADGVPSARAEGSRAR